MQLSPQEAILHSILYNQQHYKVLCKPYTEQMQMLLEKEPPEFRHDINTQYQKIIISVIGNDITKSLAIPLEDVITVLENVNVIDYINL